MASFFRKKTQVLEPRGGHTQDCSIVPCRVQGLGAAGQPPPPTLAGLGLQRVQVGSGGGMPWRGHRPRASQTSAPTVSREWGGSVTRSRSLDRLLVNTWVRFLPGSGSYVLWASVGGKIPPMGAAETRAALEVSSPCFPKELRGACHCQCTGAAPQKGCGDKSRPKAQAWTVE